MSFYGHPYGYPTHRHQGFGQPHPYAAPTFNFYSPPPPPPPFEHPTYPRHQDLEEEERAALAHLQSIQRRREEAERQATYQRRWQIEHDLAVRALEREAALVEARRAQEARAAAVAKARFEAIQAQQARAAAFEQERKRRWAEWQARQQGGARRCGPQRQGACQGPCARRPQREGTDDLAKWLGLFGIDVNDLRDNDATPATPAETNEKPAETAKAAPSEKPAEESREELDDLNKLLSLFGIRVVKEDNTAEADKPADTSASKPVESTANSAAPAPVEQPVEPATQQKTEATPAPTTTTQQTAEPAIAAQPAEPITSESKPKGDAKTTPNFPSDLNDLIYNFFGVRLEPANGDDKAGNGVPEGLDGLNNFLSQFGVVFEPDAPTTTTDSKADKGKGVAVGEKPTKTAAKSESSTPKSGKPATQTTNDDGADSPTPTASLAKLKDISHELDLVRDSFTFPAHLSFATSPTPQLLFNKTNSGYHAQANKLLQLLLAADGVTSGGDKSVRDKRREVVKSVEAEIEGLEKKRDEVWEEVKEKREKGEESDVDEGWGSGSSDGGHEEVTTEVPAKSAAPADNSAMEATAIESPQPTESNQSTESTKPEDAVATSPEPANESTEPANSTESTEGYTVSDPAPTAEDAPPKDAETQEAVEVHEQAKQSEQPEEKKDDEVKEAKEKEDEYDLCSE